MSVQVSTASGKTVDVPITPHTTIKQVLAQVCQKESLPADGYCINYKGVPLEESGRPHYSGLRNNARLELVESRPSTDPVTVNLEVTDIIFCGRFQPTDNLWSVVEALCPAEFFTTATSVPIVTYMRQDLMGQPRLESTSLEELGIVEGKAILRLSIREAGQPLNPSSKGKPVAKPAKVQAKVKPKTSSSEIPCVPSSVAGTPGVSSATHAMEEDEDDEGTMRYLDNRKSLIFKLPETSLETSNDLHDDFFKLTQDEAKRIYRDLITKREEMENQPLLTNSLRQQERADKTERVLRTYRQTVIRAHFDDNYVLQGLFDPAEKVSRVVEFIRSYLSDPGLNFHIYTTPPKTVLAADKTLLEVNCVPRAKVYLGLEDGEVPRGAMLKAEAIDKAMPYSVASTVASKIKSEQSLAEDKQKSDDKLSKLAAAIGAPRPPDCKSRCPDTTDDYGVTGATAAPPPGAARKDTFVPKWFKRV